VPPLAEALLSDDNCWTHYLIGTMLDDLVVHRTSRRSNREELGSPSRINRDEYFHDNVDDESTIGTIWFHHENAQRYNQENPRDELVDDLVADLNITKEEFATALTNSATQSRRVHQLETDNLDTNSRLKDLTKKRNNHVFKLQGALGGMREDNLKLTYENSVLRRELEALTLHSKNGSPGGDAPFVPETTYRSGATLRTSGSMKAKSKDASSSYTAQSAKEKSNKWFAPSSTSERWESDSMSVSLKVRCNHKMASSEATGTTHKHHSRARPVWRKMLNHKKKEEVRPLLSTTQKKERKEASLVARMGPFPDYWQCPRAS
jgi:hypothetical protein